METEVLNQFAIGDFQRTSTNLPMEVTMELVRFYAWVIKIAIVLALLGQLKTCTLILMGKAAEKSEKGIISYSKFTRLLTR